MEGFVTLLFVTALFLALGTEAAYTGGEVRNMRRLPLLLACFLLLTGCGGPDAPAASEPPPTVTMAPETPAPTPAPVADAGAVNPYVQAFEDAMEETMDAFVLAQVTVEAALGGDGAGGVAELRRFLDLALDGDADEGADPGNPVDAWFESLDMTRCGTGELAVVARCWADAWQAEAERAYGRLLWGDGLPKEMVQAALKALDALAQSWGDRDELSASSFFDPDYDGGAVHYGTIAARLGHEGRRDVYRAAVLRLNGLTDGGNYVFRSGDYAQALNELDGFDIPIYSNPIDGFFETSDFLSGITIFEGSMRASLYAAAWRDEVNAVYGGLERGAAPELTRDVVDVSQVHADFLDFVEAQAEAEGYLRCSDAFGQDVGGYGTQINRGRLWNEVTAGAEAELLRSHALELYCMLGYPNVEEAAPPFVFAPQTVIDKLEGAPFTPGSYAVDRYLMHEPEPEYDNPIDRYLEEHPLSTSGATVVMSTTAAILRDIWQAELEHAYAQLIACAHPTDPAPRKALERARDAFLAFAPGYGAVEAYTCFSNAFHPKDREEVGFVAGTLVRSEQGWVAGDQFRNQTIRLWKLMDMIGIEPEFAFDPSDWSERMDGWMEGDIA